MSLIHFFPQNRTPRAVQSQALAKIEACWDTSDVVVVNLPVATGKSLIAYTLAKWADKEKGMKSVIAPPTNLLIDQYLRDFPRLPFLKRADLYTCHTQQFNNQPASCQKVKDVMGTKCRGCLNVRDQRRARVVPYILCNTYMYMAQKLFRDVLIVDEAHNLINSIRDLNADHIWVDELKLPSWIKSYGELYRFLMKNPTPEGQIILKELDAQKTRYVITRGIKYYRGVPREALLLAPVDIRDSAPFFWPKKVKKIILLSATINRKDIETLGLDKRRVTFIEAASPIPPANRPVELDCSLKLSYASLQDPKMLQALADKIEFYYSQHAEDRGVVHVTYSLIERLRARLSHLPRLIWHTKENKQQQYKRFLETPGGVLMAAGMYEGIDLPEDLGRWQLITKIPWPSLADPAIKHMADSDEEWYAWETARTVLQATGRVCRSPTDYGRTIILDGTFLRLYQDYRELFPEWWSEALVYPMNEAPASPNTEVINV